VSPLPSSSSYSKTLEENMNDFEFDIKENVQNLKKIMKVIGTIDNCSNEAILSTFDKHKNAQRIFFAKSNNIEHEFCQNLVQLKSTCEKTKHGGLDHVYGAVTTEEIDANIVDDVLKEDVRSLFSVLRAIILE
ncbi:15316_t:CDS:2, partial [Gigaspora rosea]